MVEFPGWAFMRRPPRTQRHRRSGDLDQLRADADRSRHLPAGDVDYYTFSGGAGDTIVADIDASTIGSSLDSYLTLYGS